MKQRYKVRMYESGEGDNCMAAGTIVLPIDRVFSVYAATAEEAESTIRKEAADGKLFRGRIYEICPATGNPELIRSIAVRADANAATVYLDPAKGLYSEFRRLRYTAAGDSQR